MSESAEAKTGIPQIAKDLGFTIHDVLRYGFTGTIAIFIADLASGGAWSKSSSLSVGSAGVIGMVALSVGAILYSISRLLLVEPSIRLCMFFRSKNKAFRSFTGTQLTRHELFAKEFDLDFVDAELAFFVLRSYRTDAERPLWSSDIQGQFFRQHSENHLLFATSLVLLLAAIFGPFNALSCGIALLFLVLSLILFACASISDIRIFMREATQVSLIDEREEGKMPKILRDAGILKHDVISNNPQPTT